MPGCGCGGGGGGGGSCIFSNAGNVQFGGACDTGVTGTVSPTTLLNSITTGTLDACAPFQMPVLQGGTWKLVTIPSLRCSKQV